MIQQKELRVGNLVLIPSIDNEFYEIHTINRYGRDCKVTDSKLGYVSDILDIENINPIPISEEILLKYGFEYNQNYNQFKHSECPLYFIRHPHRSDFICFIHNCSNGTTKYLHQLQNLYFALTNEDLKLKIEK